MRRLGVLLSGRGSNFTAIAQAVRECQIPDAEIAVVLSNIPDAPGLAIAAELDIPSHAVPSTGRKRPEHDAEMVALLRQYGVDLVLLAGYMRILTPAFIQSFPDRILNMHPSLLPSFPGLDAQSQALHYGAKVAGCTVHFVDERVDHGVIILQRTVPVEDADTPETLSARILTVEHIAYPEAVARVLSGDYEMRDRRYVRRDTPSSA